MKPELIPASMAFLRDRLRRFHPAKAGIGTKRWSNIRCSIKAAFKHVGLTSKGVLYRPPVAPIWQRLAVSIPDNRLQWALSRFFRFCSARGIAPGEVDDRTIDAFERYLAEETLTSDPGKLAVDTVRMWNRARTKVPGWPDVTLDPRDRRQFYALPLSAFPAAFQAELERYLGWIGGADPLSPDACNKPARAVTVTARRWPSQTASPDLPQAQP